MFMGHCCLNYGVVLPLTEQLLMVKKLLGLA